MYSRVPVIWSASAGPFCNQGVLAGPRLMGWACVGPGQKSASPVASRWSRDAGHGNRTAGTAAGRRGAGRARGCNDTIVDGCGGHAGSTSASASARSGCARGCCCGCAASCAWPRSRVGADAQWRASEARTCPIAPVCVCVCVCVFVSACVCVRRTARPAPTLVSVPRTAGGRKYEVGGAS